MLGHCFRSPVLLEQALTHPSAGTNAGEGDNQRLEFLGDAVIGLCVCEYLYRNFAHLPEGTLTKVKSRVVSRRSLVRAAKEMNLQAHVRIGKGLATSGRMPDSVLGDAFEAIVAAIFLDSGFDEAARFVIGRLEGTIRKAAASPAGRDYKSVLQEYAQGKLATTPRYILESANGPEHAKSFTVAVMLEGAIVGRGTGNTKKGAEQEAARRALERVNEQTLPT